MPVKEPKTKNIKPKIVTKKAENKTSRDPAVRHPTRVTPLSIPVFDEMGKKKGTVELPKEIFGAKINKELMAQAVRVYMANKRQGTASTKTRGQVTGSTRKIYRQKGTGRARHGSIRAPIFVGGGIVFGPSPRDFSLKLSKQMKRKALFSALSLKLKGERVYVVDPVLNGRTKEVQKMLESLNLIKKNKKTNSILFVAGQDAARASRNIEGIKVGLTSVMNTYDVLRNNYIVFTKDSLSKVNEIFLGKSEAKS